MSKIEKTKKKVLETYDDYIENIDEFVKNNDLLWIDNILTLKSEAENIIFSNDNFVLLPNIKWICDINDAKNDLENMYFLAIIRNKNIRSIRDLRSNDIPLLEDILNNSYKTIKKMYGNDESELRAYFHYRPTYWHLHIHFNLINNNKYTTLECSYPVRNVIENLKIDSDYYKKVKLEILI